MIYTRLFHGNSTTTHGIGTGRASSGVPSLRQPAAGMSQSGPPAGAPASANSVCLATNFHETSGCTDAGYKPFDSKVRGQASLLMIMTLLPAFMLFAFSINVGMLVHAKINLQISADSAAYAGAAAQARVLTRISHINYMMRMNYKKFLFKYYVLGNMGLKCFPGTAGASTPACREQQNLNESFGFSNPSPGSETFPGVPSTCAYYDARANLCQLNKDFARNLVVQRIPCVPGEPTCGIINDQLERVRNVQIADCQSHGAVNADLLMAWLYNTDPNRGIQSARVVSGLLQDVGLVPSNLLLESRIDTLVGYLNAPAKAGINNSTIASLEQSEDMARVERSVLAYKSARGNLAARNSPEGNAAWGTFQADSLVVDELLPRGSRDAELIQIQKIHPPEPGISVFYTYAGSQNPNQPRGTNPADYNPAVECSVNLGEIAVASQLMVVGVYKEPTHRVYYAVRVKAKPRLLFNPFSEDLELTAYAAAAPFGSRIGPKVPPQDLVQTYQVGGLVTAAGADSRPVPKQVPNLPFSPGVTYANGGLLKSMFAALQGGTAGGSSSAGGITTTVAVNAWEAAMGPDPIEIGQYNIPVEFKDPARGVSSGTNQFNSYFPQGDMYRMWAPLVPLERGGGGSTRSPRDRIIQALDEAFGSNAASVGGADPRAVLRGALGSALDQYIGTLSQTGGNPLDHHSVNTVAMLNPLKHAALINGIGANAAASPKKITDPAKLVSSWFQKKLADKENVPGREGYSVKFIPFSSIINGGGQMQTSNLPGASGTWVGVNAGDFGGDAASDMPHLTY